MLAKQITPKCKELTTMKMIFYPAHKPWHHSSRKLVETSWLKQSDLQSTNSDSQCNIKQSPLTSSGLNLRWMEFSVSIWTHLRPKSSASHCVGQRKLVVDTGDRGGKHLGEQIGSCPTSVPQTGAANASELKKARGRSQVGRGQAGVCVWTRPVIKCWN